MKTFIKRILLMVGMLSIVGNIVTNSETLAAYYENDVTPPWGRIYIEGSADINGVSYVNTKNLNIKIYANDDKCQDSEIKYYISETPISNAEKLTDNLWKEYVPGESYQMSLEEDGTKNIYAIFKDANGNTSLIYEANTDTVQTINFDANGGSGVMAGIDNRRNCGMSYIIPNQIPYKKGYVFKGWSTDAGATTGSYNPGDAIAPDDSIGSEDSVTLYAVYTIDLNEYPNLVDVVDVGDYVNYPVFYNNGDTYEYYIDGGVDYDCISKLNGWRVLSGDKETGEVTLVSAGIPLSLFRSGDANAQETADKMLISEEFLNIEFREDKIDGYFRENGLNGYNSLVNAFTNKYTVINSDIPKVRAMTKEDVDMLYQYFGGTGILETRTEVYDEKYKDMIAIPSIIEGEWSFYYLASLGFDDKTLWHVYGADIAQIRSSGARATLGVRPVVTLKADVKAIGKDLDGSWNIAITETVEKPTVSKTLYTYTGNTQTIQLENFDANLMEITGIASAIDVGVYTATIRPKGTTKWADGTTDPIEVEWEITSGVYVTLYDDGTLAFSNDETIMEGKTVAKTYGDISDSHYTETEEVPWYSDGSHELITTVEFVNEVVPHESTARWFREFPNLTNICNLNNLNTKNVIDMTGMFVGCISLENIEGISDLKTGNVTDMYNMFCYCNSLTSLDLSKWDTSNVTTMKNMFYNCGSITSLNLSGWNVDSLDCMSGIFDKCISLKDLNLSNWDTSNVTTMGYSFRDCNSLTTLNLDSFNTENVINMVAMFMNCTNLTTIYVGLDWTTENADTTDMFLNCGTDHCCLIPTSVYVTLYTDGTLGFSHDETTIEEKTVDKSYGDITNLWFKSSGDVPWISDRESITTVDIVNKVSPTNSTARWFTQLENLTVINNISNIKTCNVTTMDNMFSVLNSLTSLDISSFDTKNVNDMGFMFLRSNGLENITFGNNWDTSNVGRLSGMFQECGNLTSLDLSSFDTANVAAMDWMFYKCSNLGEIYVGPTWETTQATVSGMFTGCGTQSVTLKN